MWFPLKWAQISVFKNFKLFWIKHMGVFCQTTNKYIFSVNDRNICCRQIITSIKRYLNSPHSTLLSLKSAWIEFSRWFYGWEWKLLWDEVNCTGNSLFSLYSDLVSRECTLLFYSSRIWYDGDAVFNLFFHYSRELNWFSIAFTV